jgi:site-specific recombinase XerC
LLNKLIHYVDRWTLGKPESGRKVFIDQLDPAFCTQWYQSWKYSNSALRQRWNIVRSFFSYLVQQGAITSNPVLAIKASCTRWTPVRF